MRTLILALSMALASGSAWACSVIVPLPDQGETWEQAQLRHDIERQQRSWNRADGVFLARVTESADLSPSRGQVIAAIKGSNEPRAVDILNGCGAPPVGAILIVFVERQGPRTWTTLDNIWPYEVRDPQLVDHLQNTAARLRSEHR